MRVKNGECLKMLELNQYKEYFLKWKNFFETFKFEKSGEDEINSEKLGFHSSYNGFGPYPLNIEIYSGNYGANTETGGCICIDFFDSSNENYPICVDLTERPSSLWEAIILLEEQRRKGNVIKHIFKDSYENWTFI